MIVLLIISGLINIIFLWIGINAFKRINIYEKYLKVYNDVFLDLVKRLKATDETLKVIDARGTFEADDEVGFFFTELKKIQIILNEFIENVHTLRIFKSDRVKAEEAKFKKS